MVNDYNAFVQVGATHTGHSYTQAGANPSLAAGGAINTTVLRFENPAYTTYDASLGVAKDAWNVHLYVQNSEQFERQRIHEYRAVRRRADGPAAADHRREVRL